MHNRLFLISDGIDRGDCVTEAWHRVVVRTENRQRLPDNLRLRIAEQRFRADTPETDSHIVVGDDYRLPEIVYDTVEQVMVGDPLAHFVEGHKDAIAASRAVDRRQRYIEIPIGLTDLDMERAEVPKRVGFCSRFEKRDELRVDSRATFAKEIYKGPVHRIFAIRTEQLKERPVRVPNSAVGAEHRDRTRSTFEETVTCRDAD